MSKNHYSKQRKGVAIAIASLILGFFANTGMQIYAQTQNKKKNEIKEETNFKRPEPTKPIKPEVPTVNRYQENKVFLEYADSLYKVPNFDTTERQILKGAVKFRQGGMWMYCDSAYYYPNQNSLDAFSNVRMEQGDTLFVFADKLFYNGDIRFAKLINGPTRNKVTMINRDVTLTTDSLDYDVASDLGWYSRWGTIADKVNTLTSLYGQYSPKTKKADFYHDVVLVNKKDGFTMLTDTLFYNTRTHIADVTSRTEIQSENDTIITTRATYYTDTGDADLLSRSMILHRDSTGNVTTLEGDSIIYDNKTRISRAFMFRDPAKRSNPMVINDTAQKMILIGGYGIYNDATREALATTYPLLMEYSTSDTLFLRADTIKTYIIRGKIPDRSKKTKSGFPEHFGKPILTVDENGKIWIDTIFFNIGLPFENLAIEMLNKAAPYRQKQIEVEEELPLTENFNIEERGDSIEIETDETLISPDGLLTHLVTTEVVKRDEEAEEPDSLGMEPFVPDSIPVDFHVALAYHRARFFRQDMQGVADSIVVLEKDSMLYLFRKPIIWSEERQVTGNRIDVHFNDSTTDWAYLPEYGLMSEHVDEDFYNQIYGKEIMAYFKDQGLRRLSVSGNVETIFLPQEEDSTFNRLVNAESSYMEVYLDSNKLDWLKMWPEVSGTVTPLFLIKRQQMYLQKFKWWNIIRPEREWYGDRLRWADHLGEISDELELYFDTPSDFGEPKSFSGTRVTLPPSTLPVWEDFPPVENADEEVEIGEAVTPPEEKLPSDEDIGENSPGVLKTEKTETLDDIEESEKEMENEDEDIQQQSDDIEEAEEEVAEDE